MDRKNLDFGEIEKSIGKRIALKMNYGEGNVIEKGKLVGCDLEYFIFDAGNGRRELYWKAFLER